MVEMRGYGLIGASAQCADCDWENSEWETAAEEGRKHHEKTGHKVSVEMVFYRCYGCD